MRGLVGLSMLMTFCVLVPTSAGAQEEPPPAEGAAAGDEDDGAADDAEEGEPVVSQRHRDERAHAAPRVAVASMAF